MKNKDTRYCAKQGAGWQTHMNCPVISHFHNTDLVCTGLISCLSPSFLKKGPSSYYWLTGNMRVSYYGVSFPTEFHNVLEELDLCSSFLWASPWFHFLLEGCDWMTLDDCCLVNLLKWNNLLVLVWLFYQLNVSFSKCHKDSLLTMLWGVWHALSVLHTLINVIISTLWSTCYYQPHYTDEEVEWEKLSNSYGISQLGNQT